MSGRFISQAAVANPAWLSWLWDSWGTNWKAIVHQTHFENCNSWLKCLWSLFDSCKRVKLGPRRQETWVQGGKKAGSKVASWDSAAPTRLHLIALICAILKNLHLPTDAYSLKEFLSARDTRGDYNFVWDRGLSCFNEISFWFSEAWSFLSLWPTPQMTAAGVS